MSLGIANDKIYSELKKIINELNDESNFTMLPMSRPAIEFTMKQTHNYFFRISDRTQDYLIECHPAIENVLSVKKDSTTWNLVRDKVIVWLDDCEQMKELDAEIFDIILVTPKERIESEKFYYNFERAKSFVNSLYPNHKRVTQDELKSDAYIILTNRQYIDEINTELKELFYLETKQ